MIRTRSTPGPSTGMSSDSGSTGASLSSCASMTTRSPSLSQASAIAPTRKSSVSGRSSGPSSRSAAGAVSGISAASPVRRSTSSRSSSIRSARRLTWNFSKDNARHPADRGRLQVERAIPRLPDGAGDEPVRRIIVKDRHESYPSAPWAVPGFGGYGGCVPPGDNRTRAAADHGIALRRRFPRAPSRASGAAAGRRRRLPCRSAGAGRAAAGCSGSRSASRGRRRCAGTGRGAGPGCRRRSP